MPISNATKRTIKSEIASIMQKHIKGDSESHMTSLSYSEIELDEFIESYEKNLPE
jgi:hypothetical protein